MSSMSFTIRPFCANHSFCCHHFLDHIATYMDDRTLPLEGSTCPQDGQLFGGS